MLCHAILVAAGSGSRAGGSVPKQYVEIGGKSVLARAYDALRAHPAVGEIVVAIGKGQEELAARALGADRPARIVEGGATRRESVAAGMAALPDGDVVLVHDAARPFLPASVFDRLLSALAQADGAVPVLPVADTLVTAGDALGEVVDRDGLRRVQTPQGFRLAVLRAAHEGWTGPEPTDDAQMARAAGFNVFTIAGDPRLDKITAPADFALAEGRLNRITRTGLGYDVHAFAEGDHVWMGGVKVPHSHSLAGHSDADVALHALTDALLGAIGDGDIGAHFPPSDPQWKGASSDRFLIHARDLVRRSGGRIDHVDVTIICEAPKVRPHADAMRSRIGELLELPLNRVSIKATTTEGLGFTGRREGIAAQAIATVSSWEE
ncbi:bifunctional 2-C-methyl-D-erythritol 4-phosphate cytidylyltransferase/2-C-methyl-D-erythritol 2,4-cyclodiphosphate synthase [Sphingomonas sp. ID0503]|uniref:bifunctional 2-C-methyl-D-erythritol 4-phosphate cytidylyltransferase/2-C-methyl-D-erythritol 2,4-cyclodiphosphate synthase n=1 Tax=Sphingomonas sp. ID0503 TaxID=3399691 RepID=UPI003AFB65A5